MKLGRLPARHDPRTLRLADVLDALPAFPTALFRDYFVPPIVPMYDNDQIGDCTCASLGYLEDVWTGFGSRGSLLTTEEVINFYSEVTGYTPGDDNTDNGANMLDVLKRLRNVGIGAQRRKILAFVKIDHTDLDHVKSAINLFGGVYVGANMPNSAKRDGDWIGSADAKDAGSWGGHCMSCSRYDRTGLWFRTWGRLQRADNIWWDTYVDECYGLLSPEWQSPIDLDTDRLQQYLRRLA